MSIPIIDAKAMMQKTIGDLAGRNLSNGAKDIVPVLHQ